MILNFGRPDSAGPSPKPILKKSLCSRSAWVQAFITISDQQIGTSRDFGFLNIMNMDMNVAIFHKGLLKLVVVVVVVVVVLLVVIVVVVVLVAVVVVVVLVVVVIVVGSTGIVKPLGVK